MAGNVSAAILHVTRTGSLSAPASMQVTPTGVNMVVGDTQQFTVVDDQGRPRSDASWSVDDTSIATIDSASSPTLTAISTGTVTLTATIGSVTANTIVHVLSGTSLSDGTIRWSGPSPSGFVPQQILQAEPAVDAPAIYSISSGSSSSIISALTADGRQIWQSSFTGATSQSAMFVPDALGGLIVQLSGSSPTTMTDLDGQTGQQVWQYATPYYFPYFENIALALDGTIYSISSCGGQAPALLGLDGGSGAQRICVPLPLSQYTFFGSLSTYDPAVGPLTVGTDGSVNFEVETQTITDLGCRVNTFEMFDLQDALLLPLPLSLGYSSHCSLFRPLVSHTYKLLRLQPLCFDNHANCRVPTPSPTIESFQWVTGILARRNTISECRNGGNSRSRK